MHRLTSKRAITSHPYGILSWFPPNHRRLTYGILLPPVWHVYQWQNLPDSAYDPELPPSTEYNSVTKMMALPSQYMDYTAGALLCALEHLSPQLYSREYYITLVQTVDEYGECPRMEYCVALGTGLPSSRPPATEIVQLQKWLKTKWDLYFEPNMYLPVGMSIRCPSYFSDGM